MANNQQVDNLVSMLDAYTVQGGHHLNMNHYLHSVPKKSAKTLVYQYFFDKNICILTI